MNRFEAGWGRMGEAARCYHRGMNYEALVRMAAKQAAKTALAPSRVEGAVGVSRLGVAFVNVYFIDSDDGGWVLVDTGLPAAAAVVQRAAEAKYGPDTRPRCIILTHGHFDHAGNAAVLAKVWDVPIFAHREEMPFLTGVSDYPPQDPSMGGAIANLSRVFPRSGYDLRPRVRTLLEQARGGGGAEALSGRVPDGSLEDSLSVGKGEGDGGRGPLPGLPGWEWVHTPGHTPGHVSLWRERDRVLVAGDALATMDLDSYTEQVARHREFHRPPVPFTPDWQATRASVERLAGLRPRTVAAGHGLPITGDDTADRLAAFEVDVPEGGRYWPEAAKYDPDRGVVEVPPPVDDPIGRRLKIGGGVAAAVAAAAALGIGMRRK